MCRMFGVAAERPVPLKALLEDGTRSLSKLSREHRDGWGIATRDHRGWSVQKGTACAAKCSHYGVLAGQTAAAHAIAHVRKKTVGPTKLSNTHPFVRGKYVLAHNGTIPGIAALEARTSIARRVEVEGDTDSERLFAFVLTHVDEAPDAERGLIRAVETLRAIPNAGAASFVFSDGDRMFAHRHGRTLYALSRTSGANDARRANALVVASEPLTDEPWHAIPEGALLALEVESASFRSIANAPGRRAESRDPRSLEVARRQLG